jgi:hypothetical protein
LPIYPRTLWLLSQLRRLTKNYVNRRTFPFCLDFLVPPPSSSDYWSNIFLGKVEIGGLGIIKRKTLSRNKKGEGFTHHSFNKNMLFGNAS